MFVGGMRRLVVDAWSWLNYKPIFSNPRQSGQLNRQAFPQAERSWIPREDHRRLAAYTLLAAYDRNQAGELAAYHDGEIARERREFGDPSAIVDLILANVLGEDQQITVPGAELEDEDEATPESDHAAGVQERLRQWAEDELLPVRMLQSERKAVLLGHSVYMLAWDTAKQRPRLSVMDPGFYFPVVDDLDGDSGDFPNCVHFAWEIPGDPDVPGSTDKIRRITYELGPIGAASYSVPVPEDAPNHPRRQTIIDDLGFPLMTPGDLADPLTGTILRQYPWNDSPVPVTCYLTDATWELSDVRGANDVYCLDPTLATMSVRPDGQVLDRLDLMVDFVPVVDLPNNIPDDGHWGQSSLAKILQGLDELAGADTDAAHAAATTGLPIVGVWGKDIGHNDIRSMLFAPGSILGLGEGGGMSTVDTSPQLRELRAYRTDLRDRIAANARIPAVAMGTMDATLMPSGYALQLTLGPLDSLVSAMRLARNHKYRLLLKFVQRLYQAGQHPDWVGDVLPALLVFGSYTPTDRAAVLNEVVEGKAAGVFSTQTCMRMLIDAGYPIENAAEEIANIEARQFAAAGALADATGDQTAVREFLNLPGEAPQPPAPVLPPAPGDTGLPPTDAGNGAGDTLAQKPPVQPAASGGKAK